jgi:hypothetical protein
MTVERPVQPVEVRPVRRQQPGPGGEVPGPGGEVPGPGGEVPGPGGEVPGVGPRRCPTP